MDLQGCLRSLAGGGDDAAERAISPVIAVALMLAITVFLAMSASVFVFDVTSSLESEVPNTQFAFKYSENVAVDAEDDFGTRVENKSTGTYGLLRIVYERGDSLDANTIEIRGNVSGGPLVNATGEDSFVAGSSVIVAADRGETVQVIWQAPDESESAVLAEFTIHTPPES